MAPDVVRQQLHRSIAPRRLLAESGEHDVIEVAAKQAPQFGRAADVAGGCAVRVQSRTATRGGRCFGSGHGQARPLGLRCLNRLHDVRRGSASGLVWRVTGEQLVENYAQRVDVARRRGRTALHLLGAGVLGCQQPEAGDGGRWLVRAWMEHLGDPEVEELGYPLAGDQDVDRFDVAVDDPARVGVGDRPADLQKKPEPLRNCEPVGVGVLVDRLSFYVLHDEVRPTVIRHAAVHQSCDVRVVERGENLALGTEPLEHEIGVHAALDELDRDLLLILAVSPLGEIHGPHAAPAGSRRSDVFLQPCAGTRERRGFDESGGPVVRGDQVLDFGPQARILRAGAIQKARALPRRERDRGVEDLVQAFPGLAVQTLHPMLSIT